MWNVIVAYSSEMSHCLKHCSWSELFLENLPSWLTELRELTIQRNWYVHCARSSKMSIRNRLNSTTKNIEKMSGNS